MRIRINRRRTVWRPPSDVALGGLAHGVLLSAGCGQSRRAEEYYESRIAGVASGARNRDRKRLPGSKDFYTPTRAGMAAIGCLRFG